MKEMLLTKGKVALVDDADFEWLSQWKWCYSMGYAVRRARIIEGGKAGRIIRMHRVILDAPPELEVDHRNHNRLDNQRSNLRLATRAQNCHNMRMLKTNTVGLKGVTFCKCTNRFQAQINFKGRNKKLGRFDTPEEAHQAYVEAAKFYYGEFACV